MSEYSPLWISIKTSITATFIVFFIGIAAAWFMASYKGRARGILDGILTLPMVLPPTVVGFILLMIIGKNFPIGKLLSRFGINIIFTWYATVIAATVVAFPLMYRTCVGAFRQIDVNVINAARTLGVSERKIFWKVAVPLAWPGIAAGTVLSFARALGEFGATIMIAGSIPGKTQTIPIAIYFAEVAGETSNAIKWVILIFIISLTVMVASDKWAEKQMFIVSSARRK
ncbi:molybdate ABC transporter permease subunit [Clostridium estertheticum]|uniref:Molybdenum transport system permease n=1 Tax=Clostridium estertheticum TaxID=238834 RepID=A0A5N7IYT6_9CLOT|nr:molybdate ABC transporter permease subunit [Clostridium estertheticum]MBU3075662.1 molybdate ABC transporter permease subunit [Clostridium estertheticum]MBU3165774.1 molybdate ABC transporter permease subunit [Clostridium estertheticum]MBU3173427.1 molybdate ABC transporter permease subunit [Clostridium estertheticum]MBU3185138.1 molybdate ABC transporter permease subunit [Clostridium estertheticum]MBW9172296.1 molybdate ABC transporter permease subunit [Clostridium estertheticum]